MRLMAISVRIHTLPALAIAGILLGACTVHETVVEHPADQPPPAQQPLPAQPPPAQPPPAQPPPAQPPAVHPAYLHALSDLRNARFNLIRKGGDPTMKWDEAEAIADIDHAINEIKLASIDDGKNLDDHPPVDAKEHRGGRLHHALEALHAARKDVADEEDNAYAQGLRAKALKHIDFAIKHTEEGVAAAGA